MKIEAEIKFETNNTLVESKPQNYYVLITKNNDMFDIRLMDNSIRKENLFLNFKPITLTPTKATGK